MAADDQFNRPYLPERYKQKVRAKQQRRRMVKILTAAIIIIAAAIIFWFFVGLPGTGPQGMSSTGSTASGLPHAVTTMPSPPTTAPVFTPGPASITITPVPAESPVFSMEYSIAPGVPVDAGNGSRSLSGAVAALREYYPAGDFAISRVNYTAGPSRNLFGFLIRPAANPAGTDESLVFIDTDTGRPWAPGQDTAAFPQEKIKGLVTSTFPDAGTGSIRVWYSDSPDKGGIWKFILASGNITLVSGSIDASTGEILDFARNIFPSGRPEEPVITRERAQSIASKYISDHNGGTLPISLIQTRYDGWGTASVPAAGQYVFSWERLHLDHPVDRDGIMVAIDAVTGDVIGYDKLWTTPDYAFSQTIEQVVAQRDATFAVMEAAKTVHPGSVESVRIVSSELRWNNQHDPGTSQRPGSVALAWKVVFDDETIRSTPSLPQGVSWVDIQTGNVTAMAYKH